MERNTIIWKAIDKTTCSLIDKGKAPFERKTLKIILESLQNQQNSIFLEIYEESCKEKICDFFE